MQKYTINPKIWKIINNNWPISIIKTLEFKSNFKNNFNFKLEKGFSWREIDIISKHLGIDTMHFFLTPEKFEQLVISNTKNKFIEFRTEDSIEQESFFEIKKKWINNGLNIRELLVNDDDEEEKLINFNDEIKFLENKHDKNIANMILDFLGIKSYYSFLKDNNFFKKEKKVFNNLRELLFKKQILLLSSLPLAGKKLNSVSGISVFFEHWPIIILNNSNSFKKKIFSIFHELVHLFQKDWAISDKNFFNIEKEREINKIAGSIIFKNSKFLLEAYLSNLKNENIDIKLNSIKTISENISISKPAILYKLFLLNAIKKDEYQNIKEKLKKENENEIVKKNEKQNGGNYFLNQKASLGESLIIKIFSLYEFNVINEVQLKKATSIKKEQFQKMVKEILNKNSENNHE